jgi:acetyl-CoA carboxylase biotin carboxylase subunit
MFRRILIANRGEIALRILRACRTLGIEAVVAYSEADRDTLAVRLADEAICIGPPDARRSYLSAPAIISAALVTGCEAIHPGYGFLSEDEDFAEAVRAHGLTFVGPSPEVLDRFASKEGTRRLLAAHGLPTIPGSEGMLRDDLHGVAEAERIGYPVLIKPSAGGGGKGMRMVRTPRELEAALRVCRSEAKAAFGDDSLYLEKWLDENRHVEVQVAVDRYGHGVHLGERDCSVQRRHQKIVEEAPTPALSPAARADLCDRAILAVVAAGYENVGTLEFLVDRALISSSPPVRRAPVTEMLTGIDLVATQIRIAAGEPLGFTQSDVRLQGHAIEFRINAEDPAHEFRPSAGVVEAYQAPGGPGIRMDSHLFTGYEVPPFYDSLLGKLIVWVRTVPRPSLRPRRAPVARARGPGDQRAIHRALLTSECFESGSCNLLMGRRRGVHLPRRADKPVQPCIRCVRATAVTRHTPVTSPHRRCP